MTRELVTLTTANICCLPQRPQIWVNRRIVQAMRFSGPNSGTVVGQEIEISRYTNAWLKYAKRYSRLTYSLQTENPISIPKGYKVVAHYQVKTHGGLYHVSPARYLNVVLCETKLGHKVAFIGSHFVSKPRKGVDHAEWRMSRWEIHWKALLKVANNCHAKGYTVFFCADMNKSVVHWPKGWRVLAHSGYDWVTCLPAAGQKATAIAGHYIPRTRYMDHPIVRGGAWLS